MTTRIVLFLALGFVTVSGCTNGFPPWKSGSPAASAEGESAASHEELPPKEAARACMVAGEQMQNNGQVEQAIGLYEKARKNDPGLKTIAHHLAVLYDIQGDSTRSLAEYRLAVEAEPKNPDVFSDLGYYYFKRDNLGDAERELRKALRARSQACQGVDQSGDGPGRREAF